MKKYITKRRLLSFAVIVAVIIIPVMYSYFYLGAFWDPYSKLEKLPVAVVNNDKGAVVNDKERNLGKELCDELKEDGTLKFVFTNEKHATVGTEKKEFYAKIVIPENFSKNIASASETTKHTATITYSPNEKRNFLASQILSRAVVQMEEKIRSKVDKEIVQELADNMSEVPDKMTDLQDGLKKLNNGSSDLLDGADTLAEGTAKFNNKFNEYKKGVSDVNEGTAKLTKGTKTLDNGLSDLKSGSDQLVNATAQLGQLTAGAKTLSDGAKTFNSGLTQYTDGVDSLIANVNTTSAFIQQYVTKVNPAIMKDPVFAGFVTKMADPKNAASIKTLQAASTQLKEASKQIEAGAAQLSDGSAKLPQLQEGIATLSAGIAKAKAGSADLAKGTQTLNNGTTKLETATGKLSDASAKLANGSSDLADGAGKLKDGIKEAKDGVDDSITDANKQLDKLDGLAKYAEAPVTIKQKNESTIPNYGTAFAPYFMSLSLWVGALILFVGIYMDTDGKFKILSRDSDHKVAQSFIFLLISFIQAFLLAFVIKSSLGLKVDNTFLFYASCGLVSMVFLSIVQFLCVHLKDIGKFLTIVLLILQLTSCGGTFPMELVPKFFNKLFTFMPMTYSVALFKQAISKPVVSEVRSNIIILSIILVIFMTLTIAIDVFKARRAVKAKDSELANVY